MDYESENKDYYQINNIYQAMRSSNKQFLNDILGSDVSVSYRVIKHSEEQIYRRDERRESNMHYFWAKVEYCYFGSIQPKVSYFGIPFEDKGIPFFRDEAEYNGNQ